MIQQAARMQGIEKSLIRQIYDQAEQGSVNLGLGELDFATPKNIRNAAVDLLECGKIHYTPNAGLEALRIVIANYYDDSNIERVCVTNGSEEALFLAIMAFVNPDDEVLIPDPGYVAYRTIVNIAGGKPVPYRLSADNQFKFDADDFRNKISERTRLVILASPSNPTGCILNKNDLRAVADALKDKDVIVISDEIYGELYFEQRPPTIRELYQHTLTISGLSKSCAMTGWRLGWVFGNPEYVRTMTVLHQYATTCASIISQQAALEAFSEQGLSEQAELRAELKKRRDYIIKLIEKKLDIEYVQTEGAFYVMVNIARYGSSMAVAKHLLKHKVITVPGSAFGEEGEGYLRISFASDFDVLEKGIKRIQQGLAEM